MSDAFIDIDGLGKQFGKFWALRNCTLSISQGEVFGLLGPNGAGKTTLLRLLLGMLRPTSGAARINGLDCFHQRVAVHNCLTYMPGEARLFRTMRGCTVLKFFTQVRPDGNWAQATATADRLDLDLSRWVGFMSTGMRQKLALCVAFAADTPLIILDEPTSNLDPNVRREVLGMVAEAREKGRTVVFSSHVLSEVEEVCDRVGILRGGQLVHLQDMKQLKRQHRILAVTNGPLPPLPTGLSASVTQIDHHGADAVMIETPGELSPLLSWLAAAPLRDVTIQPIGLRATYDRFHRPNEEVDDDEDAPPALPPVHTAKSPGDPALAQEERP